MGRYRPLRTHFTQGYMNDLNWNFEQIERDFGSAASNATQDKEQITTEIKRVEQESIERDNLISGENVPAIIESINNATNAANGAATNATAKGNTAEQQGNIAETKGNKAEKQGNFAEQKGNYADEKAQLADQAAANANNEASNLSQLKVDVVTATQAANTSTANADNKATLANDKANYAQTKGDYAKEQGDYAKQQGDNIANLNFISADEKGVAGGVATLDPVTGKVPSVQLDIKGYSLAGIANFNSTTGVVINHTLGHTNYIVLPIPSANPNGYLGEVWVEYAMNSFIVKCSGTALTQFKYLVFEVA